MRLNAFGPCDQRLAILLLMMGLARSMTGCCSFLGGGGSAGVPMGSDRWEYAAGAGTASSAMARMDW